VTIFCCTCGSSRRCNSVLSESLILLRCFDLVFIRSLVRHQTTLLEAPSPEVFSLPGG